MISNWSGFFWLILLIGFLGWWFWEASKPLPKDWDSWREKAAKMRELMRPIIIIFPKKDE